MRAVCHCFVLLLFTAPALAQEGKGTSSATARGDARVRGYLAAETERLEKNCLAEVKTLEEWNAKKGEYRRQLFDMLGLDPLPPRSEMHATTTGKIEHDEFSVEKVHFQSLPHLYVTGNLYLPKKLPDSGKAPAILYLCGHGAIKKDGISYGNKVHYQHHGAWYARHGYVCLIIDSLQLGEIEALHHGLYRENMWWWPGRGYTPAGVEAWNCIRALDYLQSRPEVDREKLGATGRSGGGAYSWWIAALDERIKVAVPVAGITDLRNHVIDGCVEGHCDCMYFNNTYQWDYPLVAALVAPRPLVISNTDSDGIFPLDGVYRTFVKAREIYALHKAKDKIALNITSGPHKDTQELQMQAFRWFDHYLMETDRLIEKPAVKFFDMEQLKVFGKLPEDQINTKIQELLVTGAVSELPADKSVWEKQRNGAIKNLKERVFHAWAEQTSPATPVLHTTETRDKLVLRRYSIGREDPQPFELDLFVLHKEGLDKPEITVLNVLDQTAWNETTAALGSKFEKAFAGQKLPAANEEEYQSLQKLLTARNWAFAYLAPRGVGPTQWNQDEKKSIHIQRRFILLGQTHEGMCALDVRRAVQALRDIDGIKASPLWLQSQRRMAGVTLAASLFEPSITRLDLYDLPKSLRDGPYFMNAQRYLDTAELLALAAERSKVVLYQDDDTGWEHPQGVAKKLAWDAKQIQIRRKPAEN